MMNFKNNVYDVGRAEAFLDKLPMQPDNSGMIKLDSGRYYYVEDGEGRKLLIFEDESEKHIVYETLNDNDTPIYASTPEGCLYYAIITPGFHIMFINRLLRLNLLYRFDPFSRDADPICFIGADDDAVVFSDGKSVICAAADGEETVLFDVPSNAELFQYLDRDHLLVFRQSIRGKTEYTSFYDEAGNIMEESTNAARIISEAGYLIKMIIDDDAYFSLVNKTRFKKAEQKVVELYSCGYPEDHITYNGFLSLINACTQAHVVTDNKLRNDLVRITNSYIRLGIAADAFVTALFDIYDHYGDISEDLVLSTERLVDDKSYSINEKRAIAVSAEKFIKYCKGEI